MAVHVSEYHQEQHLISCTPQLVHAGTSGCKCCSWWWTDDIPKHVEPFNEKIKIIHKNLCISLVYILINSSSSTSSSSGATISMFESFGLYYFLPFNNILDEFRPIIYFHNSSFYRLFFGLPARLVNIGFRSYNFLTVLSFVIRCTWPNQLSLWALM